MDVFERLKYVIWCHLNFHILDKCQEIEHQVRSNIWGLSVIITQKSYQFTK